MRKCQQSFHDSSSSRLLGQLSATNFIGKQNEKVEYFLWKAYRRPGWNSFFCQHLPWGCHQGIIQQGCLLISPTALARKSGANKTNYSFFLSRSKGNNLYCRVGNIYFSSYLSSNCLTFATFIKKSVFSQRKVPTNNDKNSFCTQFVSLSPK